FDIEIKDRKGTENVAADHLSRIENDETNDESEVDNNFPKETLMEINTEDDPWFADFAIYLEEPYLFKVFSDCMIRRCISGPETRTILDQCHHRPTSGHYGPNTTAKKVLDLGFYRPTIIKEAHTQARLCEALKNYNPDLIAAGEKRKFQLHELDELGHQAYENSSLYKERTKGWHDRKLKRRKDFKHGNKVYVELYGKYGKTFIVNGYRLKLYHEEEDYNDQREAVTPLFPKE
ncbi:hypothetical protein Tco_0449253, partial [Tanacetum coccineum]